MHVGPAAEQPVHRLLHVRVEVHRIDEVGARVRLGKPRHRLADALEPAAEALPAVTGDQHHGPFQAVGEAPRQLIAQRGVAVDALPHPQQGVDHGVAGGENAGLVHALGQQGVAGAGGGREVGGGEHPGELAVGLFRPGGKQVAGAQPRFHMAHRHLLVKGGQRGRQRGGGVAVHQDHVRLLGTDHVAQAEQNAGGDVVEILARRHDVQIVVRRDLEQRQHLIQHLAVLGGHAHPAVEAGGGAQGFHHWRHFDGLRAGAEDTENPLSAH